MSLRAAIAALKRQLGAYTPPEAPCATCEAPQTRTVAIGPLDVCPTCLRPTDRAGRALAREKYTLLVHDPCAPPIA
jgi:hypothetical protein